MFQNAINVRANQKQERHVAFLPLGRGLRLWTSFFATIILRESDCLPSSKWRNEAQKSAVTIGIPGHKDSRGRLM